MAAARKAELMAPSYREKESEFLARCPRCQTLETVWLKGDVLMPTKKFKQSHDGKVYHDCGSDKACRLFPRLIEVK